MEALRAAILDGRLERVYQPITDRRSGVIVAVEALVRFTDPQSGSVPVRLILHEEERLGLTTCLAVDMFQGSVTDFVRFQKTGPGLRRLHVNIDVDQLTNARFRDEINAARKQYRGWRWCWNSTRCHCTPHRMARPPTQHSSSRPLGCCSPSTTWTATSPR